MIDYKHFQLACPPHTGSTWCIKACALAGLGEATKTDLHKPFPSDGGQFVPRIATVRHPGDWLFSYFQNAGQTNLPLVDVLLPLQRRSLGYSQFVREIIEHIPGQVGRIMNAYKADTYIRTDELTDGFTDYLEAFGLDVSEVMYLGPQNTSRQPSISRVKLSGALYSKLMGSEHDLVSRFEFI